MINNIMNEKSNNSDPITDKKPKDNPNEHGGFYFSSSVKIYDPNTKEIIVQKRGDN